MRKLSVDLYVLIKANWSSYIFGAVLIFFEFLTTFLVSIFYVFSIIVTLFVLVGMI